VDETFRFGKNQGKLITAAMKGATEPIYAKFIASVGFFSRT
jgi:hypothetical protein